MSGQKSGVAKITKDALDTSNELIKLVKNHLVMTQCYKN